MSLLFLASCSPKVDLHNIIVLNNIFGLGGGTGFEVIAPSGKVYTLTNKHMCLALNFIFEGKPLKILHIAEDSDLCLLEGIPGYSGLQLSKQEPQNDDFLDIYGYGMLQNLTHTSGYFVGKLKGGGLQAVTEMGVTNAEYIATTILPGNSGSPVFNSKKKVVGVAFGISPTLGYRTLSVPLSDINKFLKDY